jgi:WD40 repeat protein
VNGLAWELSVATLELLESDTPVDGHGGEVFSCAYIDDGSLLLSGGWDGFLRLWDASNGAAVAHLKACAKPLSACAFSPDGRHWLSGSMEGMLGLWGAVTHEPSLVFLAHTRPISEIRFAPGGGQLATASWDRQIILRKLGKEREGRVLIGHNDIVAGCRYAVDGKLLLSWSHDGTLRLWDAETGRETGVLRGHHDRVTAGALSPDGLWAVSGGRDGVIKLWDTQNQTEICSVSPGAEVRGCFFLLDGQSVAAVDANGWVILLSAPGFELLTETQTGLRVMCAELSPSGMQLTLGGEDGRIHRLAVQGPEDAPLLVTASQVMRAAPSMLGRLFGRPPRFTTAYQYSCPACQRSTQIDRLPGQPFTCPGCQRKLRINTRVRQPQQT